MSSLRSSIGSRSQPSTPSKSRTFHSTPFQPSGVHPSSLIGKTLTRLILSETHPALTLHFEDGSIFQVRVEGYSAQHPGVPKELELSDWLKSFSKIKDEFGVEVIDCKEVILSDKAFEKRAESIAGSTWDQKHSCIAFKFSRASSPSPNKTPDQGWQVISAILQENGGQDQVVFRSYADVFLHKPATSRARRQSKSSPTKRAVKFLD